MILLGRLKTVQFCRESCVKSSTEKLPKDLSKPQGLWWGDTVVREKHVGRSEED